jgi:hypothetical protein
MLTKAEAARLKGVSAPAVSQAIRKGKIFVSKNGKIDPEHPVNIVWFNAPNRKKPTQRDKPQNYDELSEDEKPKRGRPPRQSSGGTPTDFDPTQKLYEETRYKKAQADTKSLEYAERLGVMNDNQALAKKFGKFADCLLNDLIYMPEGAADMLWSEASASDNPQRTLEENLKRIIADIIEKAKTAAREVLPPKRGVKYIFDENADE